MSGIISSKLYRRITRLRWQAPALAFLLVLAHQVVEHTWLMYLPRWRHFTTQILFYGLIGPALAWWALTSLRRSVNETETAERAYKQAHADLVKANERLALLIRVSRRLAEAEDDEALMTVILKLPLAVVPAVGCSLIRLDERRQPMPAIHHGQLEPAVFEAWSSHLADGDIRRQCGCCSVRSATVPTPCPLLQAAPDAIVVHKVHCLKLARGGREFGILNIYLGDSRHPTEKERSLLEAMAQEMSLALESHTLRARELDMLSRLQRARRLSNLHDELTAVLAHMVEALEADGGALFLADEETAELQIKAEAGRPLGAALSLVQSVAGGARQAAPPLIIRDLEQAPSDGLRSLLVASLRPEAPAWGSLALWAARPDAFTRRRAQLVTIVAGQAALLVENQRLYLQGEHRAALAERARLAREIHDGLAQTLGYLKLRASLVADLMRGGKMEQAMTDLADVQRLLSAAAVDAREAIDGLRLKAEDTNLQAWVREIVAEFETLSGIPVTAVSPPDVSLPLEVHVQLQRIVQESLSNVRKHADATRAWLEWQREGEWLALCIRDNGGGFDPDDVPPIARHGLRIMRERAELLRADFQITSRPDHGAQITIRLPLPEAVMEGRDA